MQHNSRTRLLLADDDHILRDMLTLILEEGGFEVTAAASVNEALRLIATQSFDVLLSDLQMPAAGDGLTVVSAMRNANPKAVTILFSAYPEMKRAAKAILAQVDEILLKPTEIGNLVASIRRRIEKGPTPAPPIQPIAAILERETQATIKYWLRLVDSQRRIVTVKMDHKHRAAHLPQLFHDLVARLNHPLPLGSRALSSPAAVRHGALRRQQGYTAAMMVEESRMLQVSIFQTLQNNLDKFDFSLLLGSVMAIADELESQLAQAMTSFTSHPQVDTLSLMATPSGNIAA